MGFTTPTSKSDIKNTSKAYSHTNQIHIYKFTQIYLFIFLNSVKSDIRKFFLTGFQVLNFNMNSNTKSKTKVINVKHQPKYDSQMRQTFYGRFVLSPFIITLRRNALESFPFCFSPN